MKCILLVFAALSSLFSFAQDLYFPAVSGNTWQNRSFDNLDWCAKDTLDLYQYLETQNTKAFMVLKSGKRVIEKYFDSFTRDSVWYWISAGKTLMNFCVGVAQKQGVLDINDPVSLHLGTG